MHAMNAATRNAVSFVAAAVSGSCCTQSVERKVRVREVMRSGAKGEEGGGVRNVTYTQQNVVSTAELCCTKGERAV